MKPRTRARGIALQILYEIDLVEHPPQIVIDSRLMEERESDATFLEDGMEEFIRSIVFGVYPLAHQLDRYIAIYAPEWPIEEVAVVDRNILRIAIWEFAVDGGTPLKVAINEAVELAKMFGSDSAPRFVNGVLGSLADHSEEITTNLRHIIPT
jgi:N utilization substance protein B